MIPLHEMKNTVWSGRSIDEAKKALILLHGRGADAQDILSLTGYLEVSDFALVAPQATNHQWYPYSFLEKPQHNEPWLSSALELLQDIFWEIKSKDIAAKHIYLLGFSQGACLTLEFATRNAVRLGGIVAFTGGLIGDKIYPENYAGDFLSTPVLLSTGDHDLHVPLLRVQDTSKLLGSMNADVHLDVYKNRPHTIIEDELVKANRFIFNN